MKIEIDFDNKTIEIKDLTTIGELVDKLKDLNIKDWKDYKIIKTIEYSPSPWIIPVPYPQPYIPQPYPYQPWITQFKPISIWGTTSGEPYTNLSTISETSVIN